MALQEYLDFDLRLERAGAPDATGAQPYRAVVVDSPAGHASAAFQIPFSADRLQVYLLQIGQRRSNLRRVDSPATQAARDFGGKLFDAVFKGEVRDRWCQSLAEANQQGHGLRLRLRLGDAPELADLPWEYLYDPQAREFLLLSAGTPLVHFLELGERIRPLAIQPPLRVLAVVSSPSDYDALDVEREWTHLREALAPLEQQGLLRIDRLPKATLPALQGQLRKGEYHIFHFIGHGGFETQDGPGEGVLILEDENGRGRKLTGRDLAIYLRDEETLRLAVLNCCEGARTSPQDLFAGVAQTLVRRGLPAVIAMQFEISDTAAVVFAGEFYRALADGWPVDASLAEARKAIFGGGNTVEWGTPVLHLRAADGRIFDLAKAAPTEAAGRSQRWWAEAERAVAAGDWTTASAKAEALLALEPTHAAAKELLDRARKELEQERDFSDACRHAEAGRWEEAVAAFQSVVRRQPTYRDAAHRLQQAKTRWQQHLVGPPPQVDGPRRPETPRVPPREPADASSSGRGSRGWLVWVAIALVVGGGVTALVLNNTRRGAPTLGAAKSKISNVDLANNVDSPVSPPNAGNSPPAGNQPPPVAPVSGWRIISTGIELEPTDEEIQAWIRERRVTAETMVRRLPDGPWKQLKEIPELAALLPPRPTPPPVDTAAADGGTGSASRPIRQVADAIADTRLTVPAQEDRPQRAGRPAGASFVPAAPAKPVGYWEVTGWETDPGQPRKSITGKVSFNFVGTFSMLIRYDGERRSLEGTWTYFPATSEMQVNFATTQGFADAGRLKVTERDGTFILDGTNQGTRTHLELKPTTFEAVAREVREVFNEAIGDTGR